jgi:16S rRNA (cytidine1402-2'-O)-methyltransferase
LKADANQQRGEFVILVEAPPLKNQEEISEQTARMLTLLLAELPLKQAVKLAADISREKKNSLYELALQFKQSET